MTNLKWRIWVRPEKKFHFIDIDTLLYETFSKWEKDELEIQRYTGLKDKNNVRIYEGDILDNYSEIKSKTCYSGFEDFEVVEKNGIKYHREIMVVEDFIAWVYDNRGYKDEFAEDWEIIGNIYSNPELLK